MQNRKEGGRQDRGWTGGEEAEEKQGGDELKPGRESTAAGCIKQAKSAAGASQSKWNLTALHEVNE